MVTSAMLYHVMHFLNITIDIRNVCVFLAPLFSSLTVIVTFILTKELKVSRKYTFISTHLPPFSLKVLGFGFKLGLGRVLKNGTEYSPSDNRPEFE